MALNIFYQNVRGLRSKTHTFYCNLLNCDSDIICITETGLSSTIASSELFSPGYKVYRRDRETTGSSKQCGGGALIAVRDGISSKHLPNWSSSAEDIWVEITQGSSKLHVGVAYLPPGDNRAFNIYLDKLTEMLTVNAYHNVVICGDFNLPDIQWLKNENLSVNLTPSAYTDRRSISFVDTTSFCALAQYNSQHNCNNRILDLVLSNSNNNINVIRSQFFLVPEDVHHPSLEIEFLFNVNSRPRFNPISKFNFSRANYTQIDNDLLAVDWNALLSQLGIDDAVDAFYERLSGIFESRVPKIRINLNKKYPQWYSLATIKVIKEKKRYHKRWKIYNNPLDYLTFSTLRGRSKLLIENDYKIYVARAEANILANPKFFWQFIKSKKSRSSNFPSSLSFQNITESDSQAIPELFASYFESMYEKEDSPVNMNEGTLANSGGDLAETIINSCGLYRRLRSLNINKGPGFDGIPPVVLKRCCNGFTYPLSILFIKSLACGIFPELWKKTIVIPIHKSGDTSNVTNYRPISILSAIPKLFEKIIFDQLYSVLSPTVLPQQHGFFRNRSVETNLLYYTSYILKCMEGRSQVDAVYTDFSKAFDKINHCVLLRKLGVSGVHGDLLRWVCSYIRNRSQAVLVNGFRSKFFSVPSGVPQGSHLGPLLFIVYINDIVKCFRFCEILLYADDLKFFKEICSLEDCQKLQSDLRRLETYCSSNKLFLNYEKCYQISFTRNINKITYAYSISGYNLRKVLIVKDLGIELDSKMLFDCHINSVCKRANKMLGFLIRTTKYFANVNSIITLYNAYVYSILNYCSTIWNPQYVTHINRIEKIQIKCISWVAKKSPTTSGTYLSSCRYFGVLTLRDRRVLTDILTFSKIINSNIDSPPLLALININIPSRNLRYNSLFSQPFTRTNFGQNSPINRMCCTVNLYKDIDLFHSNIVCTKNQIKKTIAEKYC